MAGKSASEKKPKFWPCSRTKVRFVHSSISIISLAPCFLLIYCFDGILRIGGTPMNRVIGILCISEILKCIVNYRHLRIIAQIKPPIELPVQSQPQPAVIKAKRLNVSTLLKSKLLLSACIAFAASLCVLFGAPIHERYEETMALAMLLVVVGALPFVLFVGPDGFTQYLLCDYYTLASKNQTGYLEMIHYNAAFAIFGAWVASAVAPLDWDRPWQAYPTPNIYGTLFGFLAGNLFALGQATHRFFVKRRGVSNKSN